jgi:hypothetical protein
MASHMRRYLEYINYLISKKKHFFKNQGCQVPEIRDEPCINVSRIKTIWGSFSQGCSVIFEPQADHPTEGCQAMMSVTVHKRSSKHHWYDHHSSVSKDLFPCPQQVQLLTATPASHVEVTSYSAENEIRRVCLMTATKHMDVHQYAHGLNSPWHT